MRRLIVVLLVATLALAAAGLYVATRFEGPPEDTTAALVPAEATAYASFFVDPSSDQKKLLRDRIEGAADGVDAGSVVADVLDRVTSPFGLPYDEVSPWIDRQMAFFVMPDDTAAVVAAVADEASAEDAIRRVNGRIIGTHAVFGDAKAVRAVGAVASGKLQSAAEDSFMYPDAIDDAPVDRLAFAFSRGAAASSGAIGLPPKLDGAELALGVGEGNAVALRADEAGLVFDGRSYSDGAVLLSRSRQLDLAEASDRAWLAVEVPNLSAAVDALNLELHQLARATDRPSAEIPSVAGVERTDRSMGWVAGHGLRNLSAGLVFQTDDASSAARLARSLAALPGDPRLDFGRARVSVRLGSQPSDGKLADVPRFREAVGWLDGLEPIGYIDLRAAGNVPQTLALLAGTQQGRTAGYALPSWFTDLDRIMVGLGQDAGPTHWRVVVSLDG